MEDSAGANVLDATRSPYNAHGDGKTDDTQALLRCLNDARAQQVACYLPNGTYLVSGTLTETMTGKERPHRFVRIQGESENGTVIRLGDNLNFTGPVLSVSGEENEANHRAPAPDAITRLTVNTGAGNPAAVGVRLGGSGGGAALQQVTIQSGDGKGNRGLDIVAPLGPATFERIRVEGFDTGIYLPAQSRAIFDHVALSHQNTVGVWVNGANAMFRHLVSQNAVPVLVNMRDGQTVLEEGDLTGGSDYAPAILNPGGDENQAHLRVKNVRTQGYPCAISDRGANIPGNDVTDYVSQDVPPRKVTAR